VLAALRRLTVRAHVALGTLSLCRVNGLPGPIQGFLERRLCVTHRRDVVRPQSVLQRLGLLLDLGLQVGRQLGAALSDDLLGLVRKAVGTVPLLDLLA